jgi:hypothetical protein
MLPHVYRAINDWPVDDDQADAAGGRSPDLRVKIQSFQELCHEMNIDLIGKRAGRCNNTYRLIIEGK